MTPPNDINDTSLLPLGPSTPAQGTKSSPSSFGTFVFGACGMYQVMAAMLANITCIQNYDSEGLMPLSTAVEQTNEKFAAFWINLMSGSQPGSDQSIIQGIANDVIANPGNASKDSILMQQATTTFNGHNTMYSQANTYWSGINNGLNQSSSDTSQTIQVDLQMYTQGPGAQMQTLAQVI